MDDIVDVFLSIERDNLINLIWVVIYSLVISGLMVATLFFALRKRPVAACICMFFAMMWLSGYLYHLASNIIGT